MLYVPEEEGFRNRKCPRNWDSPWIHSNVGKWVSVVELQVVFFLAEVQSPSVPRWWPLYSMPCSFLMRWRGRQEVTWIKVPCHLSASSFMPCLKRTVLWAEVSSSVRCDFQWSVLFFIMVKPHRIGFLVAHFGEHYCQAVQAKLFQK